MNSTTDQHIDSRTGYITRLVLSAFVDTAVVFFALGWLYVAVVAVFYPDELSNAIVSWMPIRRDTLGIVCFGLSAVAYFIREIRKPSLGCDDV